MIFVDDFDDSLKSLGTEFFISDVQYVPNIAEWAKRKNISLSEPEQPMKLITDQDNRLTMVVQSDINDEVLEGIINGLSVRWTLRDVATDITKRLNSIEKRLVYCFLKEYARTKKDLAEDEVLEDEWAIIEMEKLGYFRS